MLFKTERGDVREHLVPKNDVKVTIFAKRQYLLYWVYIQKPLTVTDLKEAICHEIIPSNDSASYAELY